MLWWGLGLLAAPTGGWLALVGPMLITFLLMKVSGVAMLDAALVDRRPGYADYIRSTPAFFPRLRTETGRLPRTRLMHAIRAAPAPVCCDAAVIGDMIPSESR